MSGHSVEEIKKETRTYLMVFLALAGLTVVTVGVAQLQLSVMLGVAVAMLIALVKGGLVAAFFMHLISEKKLIYSVLILTAVFFAVLMSLPLSGYIDRLR